MLQNNYDALAVQFSCADTVTVGDLVEISGDLTVARPTESGSIKILGSVDVKVISTDPIRGNLYCTVATRFRTRDNESYVCGEALAVGPVIVGSDQKLYQYTAGTAAQITGANAGPFLPVASTTDTLKIKVGYNGASQTFTLAATDTTAALVAAKINATATGFHAEATAAGNTGKVKLVSESLGVPLEIETVTHGDYTELGFTAGAVDGQFPSADYGAIIGMCIKHTTAADQLVDVLLY